MKIAPIFAIFVFLSLISYLWYIATPRALPIIRSISVPTPFPTPTPHIFSEEKLMNLVNEWREAQGLSRFTINDYLCEIADIRLKEIQQNWSHSGFDAMRFCPPTGCHLGENLVRFAADEEDALDGWIESPSHLEALMGNYQSSCIKCEGRYCAQEFGTFF